MYIHFQRRCGSSLLRVVTLNNSEKNPVGRIHQDVGCLYSRNTILRSGGIGVTAPPLEEGHELKAGGGGHGGPEAAGGLANQSSARTSFYRGPGYHIEAQSII